MTIDQAKNLRAGEIIYHVTRADTTGPMKAKVTSVKTWKRSPDRIEIRYKRGMYEFGTLFPQDLPEFTTERPETKPKK